MVDVDTIAAISTAPGIGAIAVVRVSGPAALEIYHRLIPARTDPPAPRFADFVELRDPVDESVIDRAVVTFFRSPASYTGEDLVEFSCHGGHLVPALVLEACVSAGARMAEPGEFTRRAYLRGKLDLVQAEAVADLIEARSRVLHRAAIAQLDRGLSVRIGSLRQEILQLEAMLAHHIDFPEEDDVPVPIEGIAERASDITASLDRLLRTAPEGELLREGALTVLAGRPNAGKSALYNALLGRDQAIVTEEPGTTRDALEAVVQLGGFPFRLVDTAGLRVAEGRVEQLGIEVARRYLASADMVLLCVPRAEGLGEMELEFLRGVEAPVVVVWTKGDLVNDSDAARALVAEGPDGVAAEVVLSSITGDGLDRLQDLLPGLVYSELLAAAEAPVITRRRQSRAIRLASEELSAFSAGLLAGLPPEVASAHLRPAETALEEILGVISVEDILDVVFREFCVGK
jgi:tRNA modification GTPase